jgi:hypothetical protein
LREEGDRLILAAGLFPDWLEQAEPITFGPAPTTFGEVNVSIVPRETRIEVQWQGDWRGTPPIIEVCLPGVDPITAASGTNAVWVDRKEVGS